MAIVYGTLGDVYRIRGELDKAEAMYTKALTLFRAVGAEAQIKQVQVLLDKLHKT